MQDYAEGVDYFQPSGWSASDNPGIKSIKKRFNPVRVRHVRD